MRFGFLNYKQFLKFVFCGFLAVICNFSIRILLSLKFNYFFSIFLSHLVGMFIAYNLFNNFVFKYKKNNNFRGFRFVIVNLLSLITVLAVSFVFFDFILPILSIKLFAHEIAHFLGIVFTAFLSYFLHKKWTFR
jgi:putative flippase GtrA